MKKMPRYEKYDMALAKLITCIDENGLNTDEIKQAKNRLGDLIDREFPVNVDYERPYGSYGEEPSCPECLGKLPEYDEDNEYKYCPYCGQRITYELGEYNEYDD